MPAPLSSVRPTAAEISSPRPGDELVPHADVVMDRGFTLSGAPEVVWPWLVQLGKRRAGWYLSRRVERMLPPSRRAARRVAPRWQDLRVGDVVPDWGGRNETFRCEEIEAPGHIVYSSRRGRTDVSWLLHLSSPGAAGPTRLHLRLRLGPVKHRRVVEVLGGGFDALTIVGLAAGLRERMAEDR